ncbi:MAG TPA: alkaline phosphatase family protein [Acidimicrobiales bacterium]|nr:alkaline phosphatase family protein [Acidimicrobiales bacterium]
MSAIEVEAAPDRPVVPDYAGACIASIIPALLEPGRPAPWLPDVVRGASQIVLLVLDGLGWMQLRERAHVAPTLAAMEGGPVTSVAPTTTSAALTSITVGEPPGSHGVVGYRVHVGERRVLNVLRWRIGDVDGTGIVDPRVFQPRRPFDGRRVPVVTKAEFDHGGFTTALLGGAGIVGYRMPSTIRVEVARLLAAGEPLVYAYYDGVDKIAHAHGFGDHYDAELATTDRLVADVAASLPPGAALLVTADHGQVDVGDRIVEFDPELLDHLELMSGEGRFRWLHARAGRAGDVADAARQLERDGLAWVRTRDEVLADGWFGPTASAAARDRFGDVLVAARAPVSFRDPAEHDFALVCRHGSLTADEMWVPLVGTAG